MVQAGAVRNFSQNWTSERGCTCGWQEPGHKETCTKCLVHKKGNLLSVEEDLGCWRGRISLDLLHGSGMRDLGFLVTVPAVPCLNWVNLSSCSLRIFDCIIFLIVWQYAFLESWAIIPPITKSKPEGRKGGREHEKGL